MSRLNWKGNTGRSEHEKILRGEQPIRFQISETPYCTWFCNCCRKTAVCIGDQLLDFSVPELVRSQSTFSIDPEVRHNYASFTLCSSADPTAGLAVGQCSAVMGLTLCMLCVQIYCVLCIGLLSAEFSTVNTGLSWPMIWKLET